MKKPLFVLLIITFISFNTLSGALVYAHSGKTNKDGCHICRTNCKKYGLKKGQYHCHKKVRGKTITYIPQASYSCTGKDLDCKDFRDRLEAQKFFNRCNFSASKDPMRLDADHDNIACE
jgi:hypothetical protein